MRQLTLLAAAAFLLVGTTNAAEQTATQTQSKNAAISAHVVEMKEILTRNFKDPSSAQYRGLFLGLGNALCGEVNAKNSYGAYVGFRRFVVSSKSSAVVESKDEPFFEAVWGGTCEGYAASGAVK